MEHSCVLVGEALRACRVHEGIPGAGPDLTASLEVGVGHAEPDVGLGRPAEPVLQEVTETVGRGGPPYRFADEEPEGVGVVPVSGSRLPPGLGRSPRGAHAVPVHRDRFVDVAP